MRGSTFGRPPAGGHEGDPIMTRTRPVLLAVAIIGLSACASSAPPPAPVARSGPVGDVRRLAVVPSGESKFTTAGSTKFDVGRAFAELVKWYPKASAFAPLAMAVEHGIKWLSEEGRSAGAAPHARGVSPGVVVADAFARTLAASGRFDRVRTLEQEPVGEARRQTDALVRR